MYKVAIIGAGAPDAGELVRLLVHHPDVELTVLYDEAFGGIPVSQVHHGLVGDTDLAITSQVRLDDVDVVFLCGDGSLAARLASNPEELGDARVVDLRPGRNAGEEGFEYGLSEVNRKPLVRGATRAVTAGPVASVALVALYPLASHLLLGRQLTLETICREDLRDEDSVKKSAEEIGTRLQMTQQSFSGDVRLTTGRADSERVLRVRTTLPIGLSLEEVDRIYESIYDDHNFTFVLHRKVEDKEVEGTNKCLVQISKPSQGELAVEAVADGRLRGGAGEALHLMNLLLGLHEKTGLELKASVF